MKSVWCLIQCSMFNPTIHVFMIENFMNDISIAGEILSYRLKYPQQAICHKRGFLAQAIQMVNAWKHFKFHGYGSYLRIFQNRCYVVVARFYHSNNFVNCSSFKWSHVKSSIQDHRICFFIGSMQFYALSDLLNRNKAISGGVLAEFPSTFVVFHLIFSIQCVSTFYRWIGSGYIDPQYFCLHLPLQFLLKRWAKHWCSSNCSICRVFLISISLVWCKMCSTPKIFTLFSHLPSFFVSPVFCIYFSLSRFSFLFGVPFALSTSSK